MTPEIAPVLACGVYVCQTTCGSQRKLNVVFLNRHICAEGGVNFRGMIDFSIYSNKPYLRLIPSSAAFYLYVRSVDKTHFLGRIVADFLPQKPGNHYVDLAHWFANTRRLETGR